MNETQLPKEITQMKEINLEPHWPNMWKYIQTMKKTDPTAYKKFAETVGEEDMKKIEVLGNPDGDQPGPADPPIAPQPPTEAPVPEPVPVPEPEPTP